MQAGAADTEGRRRSDREPAVAAQRFDQNSMPDHHGARFAGAIAEGISETISRTACGDRTLCVRLGPGASRGCGYIVQAARAEGFPASRPTLSWNRPRHLCQHELCAGVRQSVYTGRPRCPSLHWLWCVEAESRQKHCGSEHRILRRDKRSSPSSDACCAGTWHLHPPTLDG
jgi:hypothetical protein